MNGQVFLKCPECEEKKIKAIRWYNSRNYTQEEIIVSLMRRDLLDNDKYWKYGLTINKIQKYRCKKCGHVWREK